MKEWFEAEDEEFLAKSIIREEGFTFWQKKNGQNCSNCIVRGPGLAEDNLGVTFKIQEEMGRLRIWRLLL